MGLSCRNLIKETTNPVQLISINSHEELVESSGQGCGGETLFSVLHSYLLHLKISSSLFMTFMCRFCDLAVWKRTYTCFLQDKVRQSGFFCILEVIVVLVFSIWSLRQGEERSMKMHSRACAEEIVHTLQKQQTPTNHEFWKFLAVSAFLLMLENVSKAGLQKKTSHVQFATVTGAPGIGKGYRGSARCSEGLASKPSLSTSARR